MVFPVFQWQGCNCLRRSALIRLWQRLRLRDWQVSRLQLLATFVACCGWLALLCVSHGAGLENYYACRQAVWLLLGLWSMAFLSQFSCQELRRLTPALLGASAIFLLSLFLFGSRLNGMLGWYRLGTLSLQPGELVKPCFLLGLAFCGELWADSFQDWRTLLRLLLTLGWMPLALACQPDLGTTLIYLLLFLLLFWLNGGGWKQLAALTAAAGAAGLFAIWKLPYLPRRLYGFLTGGSGWWQASKMQACLRHGGWFGNLEAESLRPLVDVPYRMNDCLFACMSEQTGFFGTLPLLILEFCLLLFTCNRAAHAKTRFAALLLTGGGGMLFLQAMLHIGVNLGLLPTTGLTLPLFSYGGSSLVSSLLLFGLLDCADRRDDF